MSGFSRKRTAVFAATVLCTIVALLATGGFSVAAADSLTVSVSESAGRVVASWNEVVGATYTVCIGESVVAENVEHASFDLTPFVTDGGSYLVTVASSDGKRGSAVYVRTKVLDAPNDLRYSDGLLSWDDSHSDGRIYTVKLNGIAVGTSTEGRMDLSSFLLAGEYVASVTAAPAKPDAYTLPSPATEIGFSVTPQPLPPSSVSLLFSRDRAYIAWSAADGADGYYVTLTADGDVVVSRAVTALFFDVTEYLSQNKRLTFSISTVKGSVSSVERILEIPTEQGGAP